MFSAPKRVESAINNFSGRTWLLPILLDWLDRTKERFFVLTGQPGSGKSMVMAWLAGLGPSVGDQISKEHLDRFRSHAMAVHFCVADSYSATAKSCAEKLANQMKSNIEGFTDAFAASLSERVQIVGQVKAEKIMSGGIATGVCISNLHLTELNDMECFERALQQPLKNLYASGYDTPIILLVDAIDEALIHPEDKEKPNFVKMLANINDLPEKVRFLVTTRPDPRVLKYYGGCRCFDLVKDVPDSVEDVRLYSYEYLRELVKIIIPIIAGRP